MNIRLCFIFICFALRISNGYSLVTPSDVSFNFLEEYEQRNKKFIDSLVPLIEKTRDFSRVREKIISKAIDMDRESQFGFVDFVKYLLEINGSEGNISPYAMELILFGSFKVNINDRAETIEFVEDFTQGMLGDRSSLSIGSALYVSKENRRGLKEFVDPLIENVNGMGLIWIISKANHLSMEDRISFSEHITPLAKELKTCYKDKIINSLLKMPSKAYEGFIDFVNMVSQNAPGYGNREYIAWFATSEIYHHSYNRELLIRFLRENRVRGFEEVHSVMVKKPGDWSNVLQKTRASRIDDVTRCCF